MSPPTYWLTSPTMLGLGRHRRPISISRCPFSGRWRRGSILSGRPIPVFPPLLIRPEGFLRKREYLKKIKTLARQKGISLLVFINPYHKDVLNLIDEMGLKASFEEWKSSVKNIFPDLKDFSCCGYSDDESFPGNDHSHYYPEVGADFINKDLKENLVCGPEAK